MKIEELRLGNWFTAYDNKYYQWTLSDFELVNHGIDVDEIIKSGIPLTPGILEKAGFQYHYLSPSQHYFHSSMIVINTYKTKDAFYYESQLCDVEIKFVHQLQNLYFALTGQELNIEL